MVKPPRPALDPPGHSRDVEDLVDQVGTVIEQDPAPGILSAGPPRRPVMHRTLTPVGCKPMYRQLRQVPPSDPPLLEPFTQRRPRWIVAILVTAHDDLPRPPGGPKLLDLCHRKRHRFLAQDVIAGRETPERKLEMGGGWSADVDEIDRSKSVRVGEVGEMRNAGQGPFAGSRIHRPHDSESLRDALAL